MVTVTAHRSIENSSLTDILPFTKFSERQIRLLYGLCTVNQGKVDPVIAHYGNYMALITLRKRRLGRPKLEVENEAPCVIALHGFLNLPLDIIHETLGWTHPIELYNLIRTNSAIRQMLLTRNACSVWKLSYNTHSDVPYPADCPDYPRWTTLLFGPDICEGCGCRGAVINICFRWKMCADCTRLRCDESDNVSFSPKLVEYNGGQHLERLTRSLLVSVQHTDTLFNMWTPSYYSKRDLKSKTRNIISHLRYLQARPNTTCIDKRYEAKLGKDALFKKEARRLEFWAESMLDLARELYDDDMKRSVRRMTRYLYKLYDRTIMDSQKASSSLISNIVRQDQLKVPNNRAARKYQLLFKPELDYLVQQCQRDEEFQLTSVLASLYDAICDQHTFSVVDSGMEYQKPEWKYFEKTLDEGILQDLRRDSGRTSFSAHIQHRIHAYIDEWLETEKRRLLNALSGTVCLETCNLPNGKQDAIRLATAVFQCCNHYGIQGFISPKGSRRWHPSQQKTNLDSSKAREHVEYPLRPIFFGWGQAYEHTLDGDHTSGTQGGDWDGTPECTFNDDLYRIMVYMLNLLGLDPTTTLDSDLDKLDTRFICLACTTRGRSMKGRLPMRWRECAIHIYNRACRGIDDHKYVQVAVLTKEAMDIVRKYERPFNTSGSWRCSHCDERFFGSQHILNHVKQDHSILEPVIFDDYFTLAGYELEAMIPRNAFRVVLDANFCCQRCPEDRKTRLWRMRDLEKHLKDLHDVYNGALEDYSRVDLVATSSRVPYQSIMDIRSRVA